MKILRYYLLLIGVIFTLSSYAMESYNFSDHNSSSSAEKSSSGSANFNNNYKSSDESDFSASEDDNFEKITKRIYEYECPQCNKIIKNKAGTEITRTFKKHLSNIHGNLIPKEDIKSMGQTCKEDIDRLYIKDLKPKCHMCKHQFKSRCYTLSDCYELLRSHWRNQCNQPNITIDSIRTNPELYIEIVNPQNNESQAQPKKRQRDKDYNLPTAKKPKKSKRSLEPDNNLLHDLRNYDFYYRTRNKNKSSLLVDNLADKTTPSSNNNEISSSSLNESNSGFDPENEEEVYFDFENIPLSPEQSDNFIPYEFDEDITNREWDLEDIYNPDKTTYQDNNIIITTTSNSNTSKMDKRSTSSEFVTTNGLQYKTPILKSTSHEIISRSNEDVSKFLVPDDIPNDNHANSTTATSLRSNLLPLDSTTTNMHILNDPLLSGVQDQTLEKNSFKDIKDRKYICKCPVENCKKKIQVQIRRYMFICLTSHLQTKHKITDKSGTELNKCLEITGYTNDLISKCPDCNIKLPAKYTIADCSDALNKHKKSCPKKKEPISINDVRRNPEHYIEIINSENGNFKNNYVSAIDNNNSNPVIRRLAQQENSQTQNKTSPKEVFKNIEDRKCQFKCPVANCLSVVTVSRTKKLESCFKRHLECKHHTEKNQEQYINKCIDSLKDTKYKKDLIATCPKCGFKSSAMYHTISECCDALAGHSSKCIRINGISIDDVHTNPELYIKINPQNNESQTQSEIILQDNDNNLSTTSESNDNFSFSLNENSTTTTSSISNMLSNTNLASRTSNMLIPNANQLDTRTSLKIVAAQIAATVPTNIYCSVCRDIESPCDKCQCIVTKNHTKYKILKQILATANLSNDNFDEEQNLLLSDYSDEEIEYIIFFSLSKNKLMQDRFNDKVIIDKLNVLFKQFNPDQVTAFMNKIVKFDLDPELYNDLMDKNCMFKII